MTPVKSPSAPIGICRTSGVGVQPRHDHVDAAVELRTHAVELVDEADPRDAVAVGLPPDGLRLRLDAGHPVEDRDRAVEDAQRALDLDGEVDVPRGVDDVDRVVVPDTGRGRRGDRDAALLLLGHPVHRGRALVDLTDLVVDPGVEEDPLGGRGLARVDMGHDPDVADHAQGGSGVGGHVRSSRFSSGSIGDCGRVERGLPAVVGESLVGLGHLVRVLALLDAGAEAVAGVEQLVHEALGHGLLTALP